MFVYDFVQLELPFEDVKQRLLLGEAQWLAPLATAAYHKGEATVVSLGLDGRSAPFEKNVRIMVDEPLEQNDVIVVPIRWRATGPSHLFPAMDGHLEASRLGGSGTHVSLLGNYEPPGRGFGRLVDRMGLHHVAEAGIRSFLHRVADVLVGEDRYVVPAPPRHLGWGAAPDLARAGGTVGADPDDP